MLFIMGISTGEKKLEFNQTIVCSQCQQFGRLELFLTYTYFSLFFIPIYKWNKKFYARSSCCNTLYSIDSFIGNRIQKGEQVTLNEQDLHRINNFNSYNCCPRCGYALHNDFVFCPKCGNRLN